jgi:hypothetical protein
MYLKQFEKNNTVLKVFIELPRAFEPVLKCSRPSKQFNRIAMLLADKKAFELSTSFSVQL